MSVRPLDQASDFGFIENVKLNSREAILKFKYVALVHDSSIPYGMLSSVGCKWALLKYHSEKDNGDDAKVQQRWLRVTTCSAIPYGINPSTLYSFFGRAAVSASFSIAFLPDYLSEYMPLNPSLEPIIIQPIKYGNVEEILNKHIMTRCHQAIRKVLTEETSLCAGDSFWIKLEDHGIDLDIPFVVKAPREEVLYTNQSELHLECISTEIQLPPSKDDNLAVYDGLLTDLKHLFENSGNQVKILGIIGPPFIAFQIATFICFLFGETMARYPLDLSKRQQSSARCFWLTCQDFDLEIAYFLAKTRELGGGHLVIVGLSQLPKSRNISSIFSGFLKTEDYFRTYHSNGRNLIRSHILYQSRHDKDARLALCKEILVKPPSDLSTRSLCIQWSDVGGMHGVKAMLRELFKRRDDRRVGSSLLFYGPPGTGKTFLAQAIATEFKLNFFPIKGPELFDMYIGQSESNLREIFIKARDASPAIIFFDELDSIGCRRPNSVFQGPAERLIAQLTLELDKLFYDDAFSHVFIIGATNRADLLDPALIRSGRFDTHIQIDYFANEMEVKEVLLVSSAKYFIASDVDFDEMARILFGQKMTAADVTEISHLAMENAIARAILESEATGISITNECIIPISMDDYKMVIAKSASKRKLSQT